MSFSNTPINGETLRAVMRHVPSPVVVVTTQAEGEVRGATLGSFTSVSLDPALISFNVSKTARMHELLAQASVFAVHILREDQASTSLHFAGNKAQGLDQFEGIAYTLDEATQLPILEEVLGVLICTPYAQYDAGDSSLFLGEVKLAHANEDGDPFLYYKRTYQTVRVAA